jgi:hypothetical protein
VYARIGLNTVDESKSDESSFELGKISRNLVIPSDESDTYESSAHDTYECSSSAQTSRFLATSSDESQTAEPSAELARTSRFLVTSSKVSSAPVIMIGRSDIGISVLIWSVGMQTIVPMQVDPEGLLLTDLPFVNANDGAELYEKAEKVFESPAEHDNTRPCMLHLRTQSGAAVLLEMTLNVFITTSESLIVMAGREVDSGLAGFLRNDEEGSVTARSELVQSSISSVTMSSVYMIPERTREHHHEMVVAARLRTHLDELEEGEPLVSQSSIVSSLTMPSVLMDAHPTPAAQATALARRLERSEWDCRSSQASVVRARAEAREMLVPPDRARGTGAQV